MSWNIRYWKYRCIAMHSESSTFLALNEATIKSPDVTLVMDVELNGEHFERFRGDGLCISTPSGSTAYNKALGGAIIHPTLQALQINRNGID